MGIDGRIAEILGLSELEMRARAARLVSLAERLEEPAFPLSSSEQRLREHAWAWHGATATAYRQAAQLLLAVDSEAVRPLMMRAGHSYEAAGLPFGTFLLRGLLGSAADVHLWWRAEALWRNDDPDPFRKVNATQFSPEALRSPVQRTYLVLAVLDGGPESQELHGRLAEELSTLRAWGRVPVGGVGTPLETHLLVAGELLSAAGTGRSLIGDLSQSLIEMLRTHGQMVAAARRDAFHWRRGLIAMEAVQLETVALLCLLRRHLGREILNELEATLAREPTAALPVWAAVAISGDEDGRESS